MWRRLVLVGLCTTALVGEVLANGRAPSTSTIHFRRGAENEIAAGMTFGLLVSKDNGATWFYMCEDAVGYGGMYDPRYVFTSTGALFATTFNGLKVMRDGCTFGDTPSGTKFVSEVIGGEDGAIYYASTDEGDNGVFTSCSPEPPAPRTCNDGTDFPVVVRPGQAKDWWQTMRAAPSDPKRVYLSGYRLELQQPKVFLLFRSSDGGQTFQPLPVTDFTVMPNSTIDIVGVSATNPDHVYARVTLEDNSLADAIYRSTNGGQSWTRILGLPASIAFVARANGQLVAGTQAQGTHVSTNNGQSWSPVAGAPRINCLEENSAGEVWACTQNFGTAEMPGDGFGIMKTTNLTSWTGVLKFQDIQLPVACAAGTVQHDKCDAQLWCGLCKQLGCDAKRDCPGISDDAGAGDGGGILVPKHQGSCAAGGGAGWAAMVLVGLGLVRRRRRAA
jgi:MYXO-CTERM domain-containing protein